VTGTLIDAAGSRSAGSRLWVDAWDPAYGTSVRTDDLGESVSSTDLSIERATGEWAPIDPVAGTPVPEAILFVDGVRRIDARVWLGESTQDGGAPTTAAGGLCASYAAGVVCCCADAGAHLLTAEVRRGLFTAAAQAGDIATRAGAYRLRVTPTRSGRPDLETQSLQLQAELAATEVAVATGARALAGPGADGGDLLVLDGPLHGAAVLPRSIGYVKTHRSDYLPAPERDTVAALAAGQRTPVFLIIVRLPVYSWYLRLPGEAGAPWAGIVRVECGGHLTADDAIGLARLSQAVLGRFASASYKDARAPQNLYPIAGLERELRRRLGHPGLLYRALQDAARA
jgi:hypothetical protein